MNKPFSEKENSLIQACLENNRKSQKLLFDKYKDAMYTIAYRIIRDDEQAFDAVQEGFVNVFTKLSEFKFESTLGAWIKTIMVRSAIKVLKREMKFNELGAEYCEEIYEWDDCLTGELLDKAIAELSTGYRTVFVLIEVEGYAHKEVAEMLNISVGTSKSQLSRSKKLLQEKLKGIFN